MVTIDKGLGEGRRGIGKVVASRGWVCPPKISDRTAVFSPACFLRCRACIIRLRLATPSGRNPRIPDELDLGPAPSPLPCQPIVRSVRRLQMDRMQWDARASVLLQRIEARSHDVFLLPADVIPIRPMFASNSAKPHIRPGAQPQHRSMS